MLDAWTEVNDYPHSDIAAIKHYKDPNYPDQSHFYMAEVFYDKHDQRWHYRVAHSMVPHIIAGSGVAGSPDYAMVCCASAVKKLIDAKRAQRTSLAHGLLRDAIKTINGGSDEDDSRELQVRHT